jgi:3-hydroxy acid dehydrogenase/malonic semialdehyde reductase
MDISAYLSYQHASLKGKRALVTGASSGFGLAIACRLAAEGVNLVLLARRESRLRELRTELLERFPSIQIDTVGIDIRSPDLVKTLDANKAVDVDILVNNAGLARGLDLISAAKLEDWQEMIDTNVLAVFRLTHAVLPRMIARGGGHILMMSSIAGREAYEKASVYCASKHALNAFTKALRLENCDKNIRVSTVSPGLAKTEFSMVRFSGDTSRADSVYQGLEPLNAMDIAQHVIFCLSQPPHVNIDDVLVTPSVQGGATKVFRRS